MLHQSRRAATYNRSPNPAWSDGFYATVVKQAQEVNAQRLRQQKSNDKRQILSQSHLLNSAELWWERIFIPEFHKAQAALHDKMTLCESKRLVSDNGVEDQLACLINLRASRISYDYLVAVKNGKISFKKLQGGKVVAIDGFYTDVDLVKSSPCHVRLMLTHMIKECLEHRFNSEEGVTRAASARLSIPIRGSRIPVSKGN